MEGNEELQKKARPDQIAIKGTLTPDVTTEPVAPAKALPGDRESFHPSQPFERDRDPGDETDAD